jgi:branched-chain amino acid transport system ATP-binding protein
MTAVSSPAAPPLADIDRVSVAFGGIKALDEVSFAIEAGQIVGLIGPNGAGKTTLFNCLSLLVRPTSGEIRIEGRSIAHAQPHDMVLLGLGRTFQNVALFDSMTVLENTLVGQHAKSYPGVWREALRGQPRHVRARMRDEAMALLDLLQLGAHADRPAGALNFASRKKVEIARALAAAPQLLMLDEPAGGLSQEEVDELAVFVRQVRDQRHIAILLVEHHLNLVMSVSDKVVALDAGQKIAEGTPSQVQGNERVIAAYLGVEA